MLEAYDAFFTQIGKRPVLGRDTPNFIANRVGVFQMLEIMALTERYGLSFEEVDLVTGPPLGMPKTATYRLGDMVGLDTLLHASTNSYENCPEDERREAQQPPALLKKLVEAKLLGINRRDPCLVLKRITYSRGVAVTSVKLTHPGARYQLQGSFSA